MFVLDAFFKAGFQIPKVTATTFSDSSCLRLAAKPIVDDLLLQSQKLLQLHKIVPSLKVILVGNSPASIIYVNNKITYFKKLGFAAELLHFQEMPEAELLQLVKKLNADPSVHGILVQLPLPFSDARILACIKPEKDVDGFSAQNMGKLATGQRGGFAPCTPFGVLLLLLSYGIPLSGKNAVVMGRSNIVGKPMALMLLAADCTVSVVHSRSRNADKIISNADIVIVATGQRNILQANQIKPGTIVIDVGMHRDENQKICGDVHNNVTNVAAMLTPVPGGVGPMTIAMLAVNTAMAAWCS